MQELIQKLTEAYGPSGHEAEIRRIIQHEIEDYVDEIYTDNLGNLIATRRGDSADTPGLMLAAHMDEIGLIVTHIDDNGFLRISNIGGVAFHQLVGQRFIFANGTVGTVNHEKVKSFKELEWPKLYMDIGAASAEEARQQVSVGDAAVFHQAFEAQGNRYLAKSMDDRAGCAVLVELLHRLQGRRLPREVFFVFTVQEEVGLRGARSAAYGINPGYAIAVDVTRVGDTPEAPRMDVSLGKGPAVKVMDSSVISHPTVRRQLTETAEQHGIDYQMEVLERGGTDAGAIHTTREGVPSGVLSIPCRYVHTPSQMVDSSDVENTAKLLQHCVLTN